MHEIKTMAIMQKVVPTATQCRSYSSVAIESEVFRSETKVILTFRSRYAANNFSIRRFHVFANRLFTNSKYSDIGEQRRPRKKWILLLHSWTKTLIEWRQVRERERETKLVEKFPTDDCANRCCVKTRYELVIRDSYIGTNDDARNILINKTAKCR